MERVEKYGRWHYEFERSGGVERVAFAAPDGKTSERPVFVHLPTAFTYDEHGYEAVKETGRATLAVRFTPTVAGTWTYRAMRGGDVVEEGAIECVESGNPGYVEISARDPRYFAFTDGSPYCAIGLDLCWPVRYRLSKGREFERSARTGTLGMGDYRRWFGKMRAHGANFARIWLSNPYFAVWDEDPDELDLGAFARSDALVELAREHGVRLKLCIDNFRSFDADVAQHTALRDKEGESPADMEDFYTNPRWQEAWWRKVEAYVARYGDDPAVMAFELWNEINACRVDFAVARDWTQRTLARLKPMVPRQLVTNSLGSFDVEDKQRLQDEFKMDELDFQQVHRYLDQGARIAMVREDPVAFSVDAIRRSRRPDRPVLLAETGAVNDTHTGPFRYYRHDDDGIIFADTTFPAFFAGAAGSGHIWHWDQYVDQKDLWDGFAPLAQCVAGVKLDAEGFESVDLSTARAWALGLKGARHVLLWCRNKSDSWSPRLRDGASAAPVADMRIDLAALGATDSRVEYCKGWRETPGPARIEGDQLVLPAFRRMVFLRLAR